MALAGYPTEQELRDASADAKTLEKFNNDPADVPNINRVGVDVENLEKLRQRVLDTASQAANLQTYLSYDSPSAKRMVDDVGQPVGTKGRVSQDANPANNIDWDWDGTNWSKSLVQPIDRADLAATDAVAKEALITANSIPVKDTEDEDIEVLLDGVGRVGRRVDKNAVTHLPAVKIGVGTANADYSLDMGDFKVSNDGTKLHVGGLVYTVLQNDDYMVAIVDQMNQIAVGVKWTGETVIGYMPGFAKGEEVAALTGRVAALEAGDGGSTGGGIAPVVGYIDGTSIRVYGPDGTDVVALDLAPLVSDVSNPRIRIEGQIAAALTNRGHFGAPAPTAIAIQQRADGSHLVVDPTRKICYVVPSVGQSNCVGSRGVPADIPFFLSGNYGESLMMLDGDPGNGVRLTYGAQVFDPAAVTRLVPMKSMVRRAATDPDTYGLGVTHVEGLGFRLAYEFREAFGFDPFMVMFTAGMGGKYYDELKKGTVAYSNLLAAVQRVKELVEPDGYRVVVPFVAIVHGESDSNRKTYQQGIVDWQVDLQTDIRAITGQASAIPCICSQASTFGKLVPDRQILGAVPSSQSSMGRVIWGVYSTYLACKARTAHHMAGAYYPLGFSDDYLHLNKDGHAHNGEYLALTAMATVFGTKDHGAIMPSSVSFDGTSVVTIQFDVPVGPLVRDEGIDDPGQWGFEIFDGDGWSMTNPDQHPGVSIAPEFVDGRTVRLTCSAPIPAGPQRSVGYALQGWLAPKESGQGARGQIRDSSPEVSIANGQPLPNWMPHFLELF
jgi:hypothetical protein